MKTRSAFTLVELLVVIAIIGILVALLLPAVQAAREAGRRSSCINNVKQLGIGMHNYHDIKKWLPAGQFNVLGNNSTPNTLMRMCWMHQFLPFIEQQPFFDVIQNNLNTTGTYYMPGSEMVIGVLVCPSDGNGGKNLTVGATTPTPGPPGQGFHGNYVASAGSTLFGDANGGTTLNGMFFPLSRTKLASATDGLSQTMFFSEILVSPDTGTHDLRGRYHNTWEGNNLFSALYPPNTLVGDKSSYCNALPKAPCQSLGTTGLVQSARSAHPGGVIVGLGDASVRFVSNTVDLNAWWAASTRQGNEALQLPE